jgi:hypothetical protein
MDGYYSELKTFLTFLSYMPDVVPNIGIKNVSIRSSDVTLDVTAVEVLRNI